MDIKQQQIEAMRAQMMGSQELEQSVNGPNFPQPSPMQAAQTTTRKSTQQALREQMLAQQGSTGTPTYMSQGETYNPTPSSPQPTEQATTVQQATPVQQVQPVQQSTNTIINTSHVNDTNESKFKLSKPLVMGIVAGLLVLLVVMFVILPGLGSGEEIPVEETPPTEELEWIIPEPVAFKYTAEEVVKLRQVGYTGDEIESYQMAETPVTDLVAQAEAEREAWLNEVVAPLYDTASDEYKESISDTWLSLPEVYGEENFNSSGYSHTERKNLDYEKIRNYGHQLFIKIYLDDREHTDYFFLCITPDEWKRLNDSGNVIVNYTYVTQYIDDVNNPGFMVEDMENIFIIGATLEIIE